MSQFDLESLRGLSSREVAEKQDADGYNELPSTKQRSIFAIAFEVVREPMFLLLIACGTIYLILGDIQEALLLLAFVFVVIGITLYQERKTERALEALRDLSSPRALVIRDGEPKRIPGREVVCGDILILAEGDRVPADAALLSCTNLSIDESLLTGESLPVRKIACDGSAEMGCPGGDDLPFVYSGTLVVQGQGIACAKALGSLSLVKPAIIFGFLTGGALVYWFTGASTQAVVTGANRAVVYIKKNIRLDAASASMEDSKQVVKICTLYAQKGLVNIFAVLFSLALTLPFFNPFFFIGYLTAIVFFGLFQAIFMSNAGGAWDNLKKIVEVESRQKATKLHEATVVGDTVGDPFKDTASVSPNLVIKFTTLLGVLCELSASVHSAIFPKFDGVLVGRRDIRQGVRGNGEGPATLSNGPLKDPRTGRFSALLQGFA